MKASAFAYERPRTVDEAWRLLAQAPGAKIIAGGQTLGPMLNLRLVQPDVLIDITRIEELLRVQEERDSIVLGACITHAAIEDKRLEDVTGGLLTTVAQGIAYRAVRTRGTIGGSLAHSDPAADWITCFAALGADVLISGPDGPRAAPVGEFMQGAMTNGLQAGEIVNGVRVPRLSKRARTGYYKLTRKVGEFADAIGAVVYDPERGYLRFVAGATGGRPILFDGTSTLFPRSGAAGLPTHTNFELPVAEDALRQAGLGEDAYELRIHAVALRRALERAQAA